MLESGARHACEGRKEESTTGLHWLVGHAWEKAQLLVDWPVWAKCLGLLVGSTLQLLGLENGLQNRPKMGLNFGLK